MNKKLLSFWLCCQVVTLPGTSWPGGKLPAATGGITVKKAGNTYYFYPSGNKIIAARNQKIVRAVNRYRRRHASPAFPAVLLYVFDQDSTNALTRFEQVMVGYEPKGEATPYGGLFKYEKPNVSIKISAYQQHKQYAFKAMKYATENFGELKVHPGSLNLR